jgi:hypothetical protein
VIVSQDRPQRPDHSHQRRRVGRAPDPHPRSAGKLDLDRSRAGHTGRRNPYWRKTQLLLSPQLPPPAIQLPGMNPDFPRNRRYAGTRLQRRRNQLPLLRRAPASPTLNRRDDLNPSLSHVTIPMNSHMTHTSTRSARRPLPDGYRPPHCAVSWMVSFRDAKENLVTNRDDPFAIGQRCAANTHIPCPRTHPI